LRGDGKHLTEEWLVKRSLAKERASFRSERKLWNGKGGLTNEATLAMALHQLIKGRNGAVSRERDFQRGSANGTRGVNAGRKRSTGRRKRGRGLPSREKNTRAWGELIED